MVDLLFVSAQQLTAKLVEVNDAELTRRWPLALRCAHRQYAEPNQMERVTPVLSANHPSNESICGPSAAIQ